MKKIILLLIINLVTDFVHSQIFNEPFQIEGQSSHNKMVVLKDSTYISFSTSQFYNRVTGIDSVVSYLVRFNKRGEIMYYSSLVSPNNYFYSPLDLIISNDKVFLTGYESYANKSFAFMMRLNLCFDIEKYSIFKFKNDENSYPYFSELGCFSDSEILVNGSYLINTADTGFSTLLLMDNDFNIKWHTSYIGQQNGIIKTNKDIHLWGYGYFPRSSGSIQEIKLLHTIVDFDGKILYQYVKDEHVDDAYSGGFRIAKSSNDNFLIGTEFKQATGQFFNGLVKIDGKGKVLKREQLNDNSNEETASGICRINDNRFLVTGIEVFDIDTHRCTIYLIDSNLALIRKSKILKNISNVELSPLGLADGAILYGHTYDSKTNTKMKGLLYKVDTFLNVTNKPSILNYMDSLCNLRDSTKVLLIPKTDTIILDNFNFRNNLKFTNKLNIPSISEHIPIFPNPNHGEFKIEFKKLETGEIKIYNSIGQVLFRQSFCNQNKLNVNLPFNYTGLLFLSIETGNVLYTEKIILD